MEHHFNVEIAKEYGMLEAILLNNLYFWIEHNRANDKNYHDGLYWTYNSIKAYSELFPYASTNKIRNALKRLEEEGLIITGNYNQSAYDRTMWYAITEKGYSILRKYKIHFSKMQNGNNENEKPIPDNNTDNKTIKNKSSMPTIEEIAEYCKERNNEIDAQQFYDFYQSKGWMVGKNKMKDWKACVRTWERRAESKTERLNTKAHNFTQRKDSYKDLEKILFNR